MSKRLDFETLIENKHTARLKREDRQLAREDRRDEQAGRYIGELCRDGKTVYYVTAGGYRESSSHTTLVNLLVRRGFIK